jgi:hypothetical protein
MVDYSGMFRADPRIKRRRRFADTLQAQALRPIQAPANPYGFNPLAEALQRVTAAYGGSMASSAADQREAEQRAAQAQVMAQLLKVGSARPGQLTQTQVPLPGPDYARTRTQYSVADDGSQRAIEPLPAGVFEKAGGIAGGYQIALAAAKAQGDTLTQAGLEKQIKTRLGEIGTMLSSDPDNPELLAETEQLRALLVPEDVAKETVAEQRSEEIERRKAASSREKEIRKLGETTQVVIDKRPDSPTFNQPISITKQQLLNDIESAEQGNPRAFGEPTGLKLGADGRIVSTGPFDIGKTDRDKIARERIETAFKVGRAQRFIDVLIDLPRLSGITGAVAERLGGLAGQIPLVGKRLEDAIATKLTGASPQQRANFKVNGRAIIVGMISEMTGEESSRISKAELDITQDSLKVLEAATSPEQIIGAVRSAIKAHMVYLAKADLYLAKNRLPLNDKEAITPYINQLASFGFDQNEIVGIMSQIATAYKLLPDLPNKKGAN